jgi:transglutaminase-like putative cysteine protease
MSFFWARFICLLAVTATLARAETSLVYLVAVFVVGMAAFAANARLHRSLVGLWPGRVVVVIAFAYLLVEFAVFDVVLVMALSHFMMAVCMAKLLQPPSLRDDVQFQVLCLLLLVVAGIVSGDVVFAVALVLVLATSIPVFIRIHVTSEMASVSQKLLTAVPLAGVASAGRTPGGKEEAGANAVSYGGVSMGIAACGLVIGAVWFVLCPRFEVLALRELQPRHTGVVLTGLDPTANMARGEGVRESDRPVMRVHITGPGFESFPYDDAACYFRAYVSHAYTRRAGGLGGGWGWQRASRDEEAGFESHKMDREEPWIDLTPTRSVGQLIEYQVYLEAGPNSFLPCPSPVVQFSSRSVDGVRFNEQDQVLQLAKPPERIVKYLIHTTAPGAGGKGGVRDVGEPGPVVMPDPPLPRRDEILQFIAENVEEPRRPDDPASRETFLRQLCEFLKSDLFTYTLSPTRARPGREPVGEFLLNTRTGTCEYFATAMAVVCQLKGIPSRVVSGYRGGDYNYFGDFLVLREKHAHAWVEAFVPGKGWQMYDPTPGGLRSVASGQSWLRLVQTYLDYVQFQWAGTVVGYSAGLRRELFDSFIAWVTRPARDETTSVGVVIAFVRELFGGRLDMSWRDRILYWGFALLVLLLVVFGGYLAILLGRRLTRVAVRWNASRRWFGAARGNVEFYDRFCRRLEAMGLHRRRGQTPAEFARELADTHPVLAEAPEFIQSYYEVAYGGRLLSAARRGWIEAFLGRLGQVEQAGGGGAPVEQIAANP